MNLNEELYIRIENQKLWDESIMLKRNEYLKVSGTVDTNLYYIIAGSLKVFISNESEEHIIRFGYKNNFILSLDSFITEKPSEFYIQAIKKTELKIISKSNYLSFINQDSDNKFLCDKILEQLILQQLDRQKDILTTSLIERMQRIMK